MLCVHEHNRVHSCMWKGKHAYFTCMRKSSDGKKNAIKKQNICMEAQIPGTKFKVSQADLRISSHPFASQHRANQKLHTSFARWARQESVPNKPGLQDQV